MPENYHVTLIYFEALEEEISEMIKKIKNVLKNFKLFEITVDGKNFKEGKVAGYPTKAFYFEIPENQGGKVLKEIRKALEKEIPNFQKEDFFPHLTVASAAPGVEEKVVRSAEIKIEKNKRIDFPVEKIRLIESLKKSNNETIYKVKSQFYL